MRSDQNSPEPEQNSQDLTSADQVRKEADRTGPIAAGLQQNQISPDQAPPQQHPESHSLLRGAQARSALSAAQAADQPNNAARHRSASAQPDCGPAHRQPRQLAAEQPGGSTSGKPAALSQRRPSSRTATQPDRVVSAAPANPSAQSTQQGQHGPRTAATTTRKETDQPPGPPQKSLTCQEADVGKAAAARAQTAIGHKKSRDRRRGS